MRIPLSRRIRQVRPSATLAVDARARELKAQGIDIVSFGAGEPDFDTPDRIKSEAIRAIGEGFTKYTSVGGTPELKDAIRGRIRSDQGLDYGREEVTASCGAKHSLYNLMQVLLDPGDEAVIPAPYWVSYPDMVALAGGVPKVVKTREEDGFRMKPAALRRALTRRTRVLILNSPCNPTGACYHRGDLEAILEVVRKTPVTIVSDEIYDRLVYDGYRPTSVAALGAAWKSRTVLVNGVSKAYAMTGWRVGYLAGPREVVAAVETLQSQSTSNPASISIRAATEALAGPQEKVEEMRREFERRRNYIVERLNRIPGVHTTTPQGAFYVFPRVSDLYGKRAGKRKVGGSLEMASYLLEEARVAVVPGAPFGDDRYLRLSYATSQEKIREGMDRIEAGLSRLR